MRALIFVILLITMPLNLFAEEYYSATEIQTRPLVKRYVNYGRVYSTHTIQVRLSNGQYVDVPIINGCAPQITVQKIRGVEYQTFDYRLRRLWHGGYSWGEIKSQQPPKEEPKPQEPPKEKKPPDKPKEPAGELEETNPNEDLFKNMLPKKDSLFLKKPSEV